MKKEQLSKDELITQLSQGFNSLTGLERLALSLTYFEEMSDDEICLAMDIEPFTYGTLITNARYKMRCYTSIFDIIDKNRSRGVEHVLKDTSFPSLH